jgi:hypothetical protein
LSEKTKYVSVYGLVFNNGVRDICFYVGRTEDTDRRLKEHRRLCKDPLETTAKYRFIRELEEQGIEWRMEIFTNMAVDDDDTEYEWVLRIARNNRHDGIAFYNEMPLTNLRRGDMLEEMLAEPQLNTAQQIKEWRQIRELRKTVQYEAAKFSEGSGAARSIFEAMGGQSVIKGGVREWQMPVVEKKRKKK